MTLKKMLISEIIKLNRKTALITLQEKDNEKYKILPLDIDIEANLKMKRKNKTHNTFIQLCLIAIDRGILTRPIIVILNPEYQLNISTNIIQSKLAENQFDDNPELRTIIDIFEELFLERIITINAYGKQESKKGSIKFAKLDEIKYRQFCQKCYNVFEINLNTTIDEMLSR